MTIRSRPPPTLDGMTTTRAATRRVTSAVGAGPDRASDRASQRLATLVALVGVLLVLVAGAWSYAEGWGRAPITRPGELVVGDGVARVDAVVSAASPMGAMPGMGSDPDPVPEGHRRISVNLTLQAVQGDVRYSAREFRLSVQGDEADLRAERSVLPGHLLPEGTQLSGTLLFDVPTSAGDARLSHTGGGSTRLTIPAEAGPPAGPGAATPHGSSHDGGARSPTDEARDAAAPAGPSTG